MHPDLIPHLRCPVCGGGVAIRPRAHLECGGCGASFPIVCDVPVMIADAVLSPLPPPPEAAIDAVIAYFSLPNETAIRARVIEILGRAPVFGSETIRTEAVQFANRMDSSLRERGEITAAAGGAPDGMHSAQRSASSVRAGWLARLRRRLAPTAPAPDALARTAYRIGREYLPRRLQAGATIDANVRIRNAGLDPLRSDGPVPAYLSYWWHDADGRVIEHEGLRTRLPLPLRPGQEIAVPQRFRAPPQPGAYVLEIKLVCEGLAWLEEGAKKIPVHVTAAAPDTLLGPAWRSIGEDALDYKADHDEGAALLQQWLEKRGPGRKRVLEIGGNAHPMVAVLDVERFVVDVDLQGLQCGTLWQKPTGFQIHNVCADAAALPFGEGFFDAITMFASLHHFENPTGLLAHLKSKLAAGGFIAVMSEPLGHYDPEQLPEAFRLEFERGVNEQSFTHEEYARMFAAAGLVVEDAPLRRGSLRACLVPRSESATEA